MIGLDYDKIFRDRLIIVTGAARSGTTLVGKLVGSFKGVYYSFEPASFILIATLIETGYLGVGVGSNLLKAVLFEDVFLQLMHGRNLNFNKNEDSYVGNYINPSLVETQGSLFNGRADVVDYLKEHDCFFVVKIPNIQPLMGLLVDVFPGVRFIHILRDGNEVVSSSMRCGFYSEDYFNERDVGWCVDEGGVRVPWYVEEGVLFSGWNHPTRCAYIWRVLNEEGLLFARNNESRVMRVCLDGLVSDPEKFVVDAERFVGSVRTEITERHMESIASYPQRKYPDNAGCIEEPERGKFIEFMTKHKYVGLEVE